MMSPRALTACLLCLSFIAAISGRAMAFSPAESSIEARLHGDHIELQVRMDLESAWRAMGEPASSAPDVAGSMPRVRKYAAHVCEVSAGNQVLTPTESLADLREGEGGIIFHLVFLRPSIGPLTISAPYLSRLLPYHRATVALWDEHNTRLGWSTLNAVSPSAVLPLPGVPWISAPAQSRLSLLGFAALGFKHFVTGYAHIALLCALLVVSRRASSTLAILVAFTLAHSLTLALTALNVVSIPSPGIDRLIAATVVAIGLETLLSRGEPKARYLWALGCGLIHGLGFGNALRAAGLGLTGTSALGPLLANNLGLELGQLAVLVILLPALWQLNLHRPVARYAVPAVAVLAVLLGGYGLLRSTVLV